MRNGEGNLQFDPFGFSASMLMLDTRAAERRMSVNPPASPHRIKAKLIHFHAPALLACHPPSSPTLVSTILFTASFPGLLAC